MIYIYNKDESTLGLVISITHLDNNKAKSLIKF